MLSLEQKQFLNCRQKIKLESIKYKFEVHELYLFLLGIVLFFRNNLGALKSCFYNREHCGEQREG